MESWWNGTDGEVRQSERNSLFANLFTTNSIWSGLGSNRSLRVEGPGAKCMITVYRHVYTVILHHMGNEQV
jgi:hypothetical protein